MRIAFDIDDTLWKIRPIHMDQVPDYDLIQVLLWFYNNGDKIFFWSAGGQDYTQQIVKKLGLDIYGNVIEKSESSAMFNDIQITFDDQEVSLGSRANVRIKR